MQYTLVNSVLFKGVGLHSGADVTMTVSPALAGEGIRFIRKDVEDKDNTIPALWNVVETSELCTLLKNRDGVQVSTVEHLMAAFAGCGIDNATVILDGPEVPIMDGSALPFVEAFQKIGIESVGGMREAIRILKPVEVTGEDGSFARFEPAAECIFDFTIEFDNKFIGHQQMEFTLGHHNDFKRELADSPTFTTKNVIDFLRSKNLIKGGSLANADVYDTDTIHRETTRPRQDKAAVRHKLLDAVGDTYLMGAPFIGRFTCVKGGHALTNQLIRKVMDDVTAYAIVEDTLGIAQPFSGHMSDTAKLAYNA